MGLLDDAIREHLDLKRRRGADPTEVQRAEREALGPVRRGPEALEQMVPPIGDSALHGEGRQPWLEPTEGADGLAPIPEAPPAGPTQSAQRGQLDDASLGLDEPEADVQGATPAPHPASSMPERQEMHLGEETAEYESVPPVERDESDDMLKETPEFLQDTPDHDRLWFEQRPPRDFDFDG